MLRHPPPCHLEKHRSYQAVGALLDSGCDVTLVDNQGLTAAELADKCDQPEAAALIRGEITLDQLHLEEHSSDQELPPQRPSELYSPRLTFPPPPPFPPEEEEEEVLQLADSVSGPNTSSKQAAYSDNNSNGSDYHHDHRQEQPSALLDSPSSYPTPPPPVLHDSPLRGRESIPTPPLPPPPPQAPPTFASDSARFEDPRETEEREEEVFHRSVNVAQAHSASLRSSEGQGQRIVRRTISKASVNSSTSDIGTFEVTTVVADVHKSRGSIDSVSAVQAVPANSNITSAVSINSVAVSSSTNKDTPQFRKFSVLKHIPQNTGIQERPELEANSSNSNNHFAVNSRGQRSPSPPPLSPGSESFDSEDISVSASTSCSNLQHQDTDFPPPPPHLLSQSREASIENFPPPPSEFLQAQSSSLYEELPPPPQQSSSSEWQAASSSQDFPAPPSPARLAIASRTKLKPSSQDHTEKAASTSNFKQYFDSGTKANFAKAKALFGAVYQTTQESDRSKADSNILSRVSNRGRETSPRPNTSPSYGCVNPDSGERETDCHKSKKESGKTQKSTDGFTRGYQPSKLMMDSAASQNSNGPVSPALSSQSGGESSLSQDSVHSVINDQGGHVTIISTSGGEGGQTANGASATDKKINGTAPGATSANTDIVKAPVPVCESPSSTSTSVVMRGGSGGSGRDGARMVVSAGPEMLSKPGAQNGRPSSSSSSSQPASPPVTKNKHDLIADIQSAVSGTSNLSLRRAKSRGEGVSMVYSSKRNSTGQDQSKMMDTTRPLTGDFDPKNFLDKVETVDSTGRTIPEWRRHVLAKHAAEKAQKEFEEKRVVEDYESRFKDMPAWKRALIERREAQAR
ncbi:ankyrin repeat and SAM domain-containing protein 6 [Elysia marginata]|uniref:Ankyrin repeat and SAM domain-containing protein 6 n=1 Tax=Elysia marginata TaxID=1093978 RepID=A0AAV4F4S5_9GAST|nr:ankyrin repeat and SAM domain-containing protein 6 [Elysia marginata]